MPTSVVITDANTAVVTFDSPVVANAAAHSTGSYVIVDRVTGEGIPLRSVVLTLDAYGNATSATILTRYFFLRRGLYSATLMGLSTAGSPAATAFLNIAFVSSGTFDTVIEATTPGASGNSLTLVSAPIGEGAGRFVRVGNAFTFAYESGVTTVANFEAAVTALVGADDLIGVRTPGTGTNPLMDPDDSFGSTSLAGGTTAIPDVLVASQTVLFRDEMPVTLPSEANPSVACPPASGFFAGMQRALFSWVNTASEAVLGNVLYALSAVIHVLGGDEVATGGLAAAKEGFILQRAVGVDLDVIGQNYGVPRPAALSDASYRLVIAAMAFEPKLVIHLLYDVLSAILGPKGTVGWSIYEVRPGTITINIGNFSMVSGPPVSAYVLPYAAGVVNFYKAYLTSGTWQDNVNPMYLSPRRLRVPSLELLIDLCRAAGVSIELVKNGV